MDTRPAEVDAIIKFARVGLTALSERVMTVCGFIGALALFGYAVYEPTWPRAAAASLYAILIFWPLVRLEYVRTKGD